MAIEKTEAFVLKAFNWSESSRTISFFTRDYGKLPLTDRGGRALKSKRGRALTFARLELTFYSSDKPTPGYVSEINALQAWTFEGEAQLGRLAFASAACELLWQALPDHEAHSEIYSYTLKYFDALDSVPRDSLPALFLAYLLRVFSFLGYQPLLTGCAGCGRAADKIGADSLRFSPERGGLVCGACQRPGERYIALAPEAITLAASLQAASLAEAQTLRVSFDRMNRIADALLQFLQEQAGIHRLHSLEFLDKLKVAHL